MHSLSNLKICYLAGTLGQGGAERQLFYALRALRQSGANVRLLSLDSGAFWEEPIKRLGVSVSWVGQDSSRFKRVFRILKQLRKDAPDIFQSQHFYTNGYTSLSARFLKRHAIGALRSNGIFDLSECGLFGGQINLRLPKTIAANSQTAIRHAVCQGVPATRLYFLPNVVDTEKFKPLGELQDSPVTLLAVGRLTKEKRFDRFLTLLGKLRNEHRLDVCGLIVGPSRADQDLGPQLLQQASTLGLLPSALQFRGSIADMPTVYREATACVLSSDHEGTPNVLLEAMASGLPVVATAVGGVPEIVHHGQTGFVAPPDDIVGLVSMLRDLIVNPGLRKQIGLRARAYVEEYYSAHRLPLNLLGLYNFALSGPLQSADKKIAAKQLPTFGSTKAEVTSRLL